MPLTRFFLILPTLVICLQTPRPADAQNQPAATKVANTFASKPTATDRDLSQYEKSIKPILQQACFDCHSGDDVEGNFRVDRLDPNLVRGADIVWWLEVYSVISKGEMPPDPDDLSDENRTLVVDWLAGEIQAAEKRRNNGGSRSSFRRLTKYEYNYALQDLLGVPWTFSSDLPSETSEEDGFENNAHSLRMSAKQVETYQALALKALQRVTVRGEQPPVVHWSISIKDAFDRKRELQEKEIESTKKKRKDDPEKLAKDLEKLNKQFQASFQRSHYLEHETGQRAKIDWDYRKAQYAFQHSDSYQPMPELGSHFAVVLPGRRQDLIVDLGDQLPNEGTMRVRIRASRAEAATQRIPSLQLSFGFRATDQGASVKRFSQQDVPIEASFGQPEIYQWDIPLGEIEHRNTYRGEMELGDQPNPSEYISFSNNSVRLKGQIPAVVIDHVEVSAPIYKQWPPEAHKNLYVESEKPKDENVYAQEIIAAFMSRAWRGSQTSRDVDRKLKLFEQLRRTSADFQEAMNEVLATILTSPKFLYVLPGEQTITQSKDRLTDNELATRLSLFLWCSLPDETLLGLASAGRLNEQNVLQQQVERMLVDPKTARFNKHFVQQWLKMRPLEYLSPTKGSDGLDAALLESMKMEPVALFTDMLKNDSSIVEFLDSDYLVINERLGKHYGIPDVWGNHFRRVSVPADVNRSGLLTQAGLLTMNSDGEDSHPVKRGVWLLTNLLNDPPPPAPPAVPEIDLSDPAIAKMTLKERIEDHRNHPACLSCHQKIDPWGIALENYDAMGRWRDEIDEKAVDATSELPNKVSLDGIKGLKRHLAEDRQDQFVRATVEKMASFALGRQLDFGDRVQINDIAQQVKESGSGLRSLVFSLVKSPLFQAK
jgi:mono/diheme cytochrome c family protein